MLIYTLLGKNAEQEFTKTWGCVAARCVLHGRPAFADLHVRSVGYAMNNCTEWQEVFKTAAKAALLIVILDALRVTRNSDWFEVRTPAARFLLSGPDASCAAGAR